MNVSNMRSSSNVFNANQIYHIVECFFCINCFFFNTKKQTKKTEFPIDVFFMYANARTAKLYILL